MGPTYEDGDGFILTLSSDDESKPPRKQTKSRSDKDLNAKKRKLSHPSSATKNKRHAVPNGPTLQEKDEQSESEDEDATLNPDLDFSFPSFQNGIYTQSKRDGLGEVEDDFDFRPGLEPTNGTKKSVDIDELVKRSRNAVQNGDGQDEEDEEVDMQDDSEDETMAPDGFGMGANMDEDEEEDAGEVDDVDDEMPDMSDHGDKSDSGSEDEDEPDEEELAKREAFFAPEEPVTSTQPTNSFQAFSLSRPILRGLTSMNFTTPTPIQKSTIPMALLGKDVVGGAVTGSGKTAAFIIPILERLLYRPKKVPTSRVAILMPTRELAVQCFNVARQLAGFTDITFCQLVGGFSLREQEAVLRTRPDVIIATPGRFIDHMRNSPSFTIDTLEILVLDEADRMLEDGFADELNEILTAIPKSRQTMLFSATMTESVDRLVRVGLNRPVRLMVSPKKQTVGTLSQEFVRLRPGREHLRMAYLVHLSQEIFTDRAIIFFRQKKEAHRARVIFALLGIKAAELHGSMTQDQRVDAIASFTSGSATHLLATDLASRGLDIPNVASVINYEAPQTHDIYLHRVGRTARAGRSGRSCTLAAETDRKLVKQIVKSAKSSSPSLASKKLISRSVQPDIIDSTHTHLATLDREIKNILTLEKEEKLLNQQSQQITRGENLIKHEKEIHTRPKRTWFATTREKEQASRRGAAELNGDGRAHNSMSGRKERGNEAVAKLLAKRKTKAGGGGKLSAKDKKALDARRERVQGSTGWQKRDKHSTSARTGKSKMRDRKPKVKKR